MTNRRINVSRHPMMPALWVLVLLLAMQIRSAAEMISIDFNTFALKGEKAEMKGKDENFGIGNQWNHVAIPSKNRGEVEIKAMIDSEGRPTPAGLHIKGEKISSWWSGEKRMPESRMYRDYMKFDDPAAVTISGLQPETAYELAVFGFPLTWGSVELELNGQSLKVLSGPSWKDKQQAAGVLKVETDGEGRLKGTVKGMWSGLHISTDALKMNHADVAMIEGPEEKEKPPEFPPTKSMVYKKIDGVDLSLDIYNPAGHLASGRTPAIVFFHGGSWSGGWKTQFSPQCHYLASRGMVAITVQYRVTGRQKGSTPDNCVRDAKSAMRWVREHANELGIDPGRLAAGGGSAGGHLAAAVAYLDLYDEEGEDLSVSCRPTALALFNPVIDNGPDGYHFGPQPIRETWEGWSPMHNITKEKAVPTIFFLGSEDHLIPVATGEEYKKRTEAAGAICEFYVYPGAKHGFFNGGDNLTSILQRLDDFFVRLGYLEKG